MVNHLAQRAPTQIADVSVRLQLHLLWHNARVDRLFALAMGACRPIDGAKSQVERLVRAAKRCGPVGRPDGVGQLARSHREAV